MYRAIAVLVFATACASGGRAARGCGPLPEGFLGTEGLYTSCEVDRRVELINRPRPDFSQLKPLGMSGCYSADYVFVVSPNGIPDIRSVKLLRDNSPTYADAMRNLIHDMRFKPAMKNGAPVSQLYEFKSRMRYTVSSTATMNAGSRRAPPC